MFSSLAYSEAAFSDAGSVSASASGSLVTVTTTSYSGSGAGGALSLSTLQTIFIVSFSGSSTGSASTSAILQAISLSSQNGNGYGSSTSSGSLQDVSISSLTGSSYGSAIGSNGLSTIIISSPTGLISGDASTSGVIGTVTSYPMGGGSSLSVNVIVGQNLITISDSTISEFEISGQSGSSLICNVYSISGFASASSYLFSSLPTVSIIFEGEALLNPIGIASISTVPISGLVGTGVAAVSAYGDANISRQFGTVQVVTMNGTGEAFNPPGMARARIFRRWPSRVRMLPVS